MSLRAPTLALFAGLLASGCTPPTVEQSWTRIFADTLGAASSYVLTPDLYRYDVTPSGARLRLVTRFEYAPQVFFYNDTVVVVSEIVPWEDNRLSVTDTRTGRKRTWAYETACGPADGADQSTAYQSDATGHVTVYWGCVRNDRGPGYLLDIETGRFRRGPHPAAALAAEKARWQRSMLEPVATNSRLDPGPPPSPPPAGYTARFWREGGRLTVVEDSAGGRAVWDGERLFQVRSHPVRLPYLD